MSIDTVTLAVTKRDGDVIDLAPIAKEVEIVEGRSDSSFFDAPGSCVVRVYMEDDTITRTNYVEFHGASLTVTADGVKVWEGSITAVSIQPDEELDNNWIQIQAYSLDYRISSGDTLEGPVGVTLETEAQYNLLNSQSPDRPTDLITVGTTDNLILVFNKNTQRLMVWDRVSGERKAQRDTGSVGPLSQIFDSIPDQCTFENFVLRLGWDIEREFLIPSLVTDVQVGTVVGIAYSAQDRPDVIAADSVLIDQLPGQIVNAVGYAQGAPDVESVDEDSKWTVRIGVDGHIVDAVRGVTAEVTGPPVVRAKPNPWPVGTRFTAFGTVSPPIIDGKVVAGVAGLTAGVTDPPGEVSAIVAESWKVPAAVSKRTGVGPGAIVTVYTVRNPVGIVMYATPED